MLSLLGIRVVLWSGVDWIPSMASAVVWWASVSEACVTCTIRVCTHFVSYCMQVLSVL